MTIAHQENRMLRWYLIVWGVYFLLLALTPARSIESTGTVSVLLIFSYLLVTALVAIFFGAVMRSRPASTNMQYELAYMRWRPSRVALLTVLISMAGLGLHIYDKVFVMGLDFSQGVASARHQWIAEGVERGSGISSWQSAAGHILINFNFITVLVCLLFWEKVPSLRRAAMLVIAIATMLVYAATMGNRSVPFVFLAFCMSLFLVRRAVGKPYLPGSRAAKMACGLILGLVLVYALYVFSERAELSNVSIKEYTRSFFFHLGAQETAAFDLGDKLPSPINDMYYLIQLTILYLVHTQWTFDFVLTLPEAPGGTLIGMLYQGLAKIGITGIESYTEDRAFKGVLLSLPGSAWYDFGAVGFYLFAILHGFTIFLANDLLRHRATYGTVCFFILVGIFSLLSPLTSAANLMVFPFLAIALCAFPMLQWIAKIRLRPAARASTIPTRTPLLR